MKQRAMTEEEKRRINEHPILHLPAEDRTKNDELYLDFFSCLLKYMHFVEEEEDGSAIACFGEPRRYSGERTPASALRQFDSVIFAETVNKSLRSYESGRVGQNGKAATFLTFFNYLYLQSLHKGTAQEPQITLHATRKQRKTMRSILKFQYEAYGDPNCAQIKGEGEIRALSEAIGESPDAIRDAIEFYRVYRQVQSLDDLSDTESGSPIEVADPGSPGAMEDIELADQIVGIFESICDMDDCEYPRLFLTNDILARAVDDTRPEIESALLKHQRILLKRVFVLQYIYYVFQIASIFSMEMLLNTPPKHKLNDATIGRYKGVVKSYISKERKKYQAQIAAIYARL